MGYATLLADAAAPAADATMTAAPAGAAEAVAAPAAETPPCAII